MQKIIVKKTTHYNVFSRPGPFKSIEREVYLLCCAYFKQKNIQIRFPIQSILNLVHCNFTSCVSNENHIESGLEFGMKMWIRHVSQHQAVMYNTNPWQQHFLSMLKKTKEEISVSYTE